jgi:hypothetical protein
VSKFCTSVVETALHIKYILVLKTLNRNAEREEGKKKKTTFLPSKVNER